MKLGHYIQKGIDLVRSKSPITPKNYSSIESATEEPDIYELFKSLGDLKNAADRELPGGLAKDPDPFLFPSSLLSGSVKEKERAVNRMLKEMPFGLSFVNFSDYGKIAELWFDEKVRLYFRVENGKKTIAEKFGLTPVCTREYPWKEIHFKEGDYDIFSIADYGQINLNLEYPAIQQLLKEVISLPPPPGIL